MEQHAPYTDVTPKESSDVPVDIAPITLNYWTLCLLRYQVTKIIIKHDIHLSTCHSMRSKDSRMSENSLCNRIAAWRTQADEKMWDVSRKSTILSITKCCQMDASHGDRHSCWSAYPQQPSGQDTPKRLYHLVPYRQDKCISTQHILSVSRYTRPARDARKVLKDTSLKSVGTHESLVRVLQKCNKNDT